MADGKTIENPELRFSAVLVYAANLPGVRIEREAYLRRTLGRVCSEEQVRRAVEESPAAAGIPPEVLEKAANESIRYEAGKVSALSAAAGLPGLLFLPATVPADLAQYFGHMLRIAQKLAYLYSWPDLFSDQDDLDDATKNVLILFMGVMFGTQSANSAVGKLATQISEQVVKQLPRRALTQGVVYPVVKKVAAYLGVEITKQSFAKGVSKAVPVVGALLSGGLTLATYLPMAKRLKNHLAGLALARPGGPGTGDEDVIDVEGFEEAEEAEGSEEAEGGAAGDGSAVPAGSSLVARIPRPWRRPRPEPGSAPAPALEPPAQAAEEPSGSA
ncbi:MULTISPECIES: hypothetical protein [Kitasatospora]|uniref:EcsC family protein n=1 Tax=Kitasatospora setae (strain ATCC 33774 / DSM 43861 / JCM 3304 / KCC A-0304 / NBRC 14216 / KM-6054) TaxID=452652 RepID=E4N6W1_KITSK|nr:MULTISPECIES: hypothetical protein [Kitasatospora]BAJ26942.1 hypothetical protein KSE_11080 [Kitasatospora setae KM-6054]